MWGKSVYKNDLRLLVKKLRYAGLKVELSMHSAGFLCYFFDKMGATGCKIFIMYFFALISNPQSELENFRRVFFYSHFNF